jgi:group I intron endonuclease
MIIYKVENLINGKVYIGKTIQSLKRRKTEHLSYSRREKGNIFHRAIKKYGEENFKWEVIAESNSEIELNELEKKYIKEFDSKNRKKGYNLTDGGEGLSGYCYSEEQKKNISLKSKGRKWSEDSKKRMSLKMKGFIFSEDRNKKISIALKGKKKTEEHIENFKKSRSGYRPTEETKRKTSASLKGRGLGIKKSEETKNKLSISKKGSIPWNKGLKKCYTEDTLKRMSESAKTRKRTKRNYILSNEIKIEILEP